MSSIGGSGGIIDPWAGQPETPRAPLADGLIDPWADAAPATGSETGTARAIARLDGDAGAHADPGLRVSVRGGASLPGGLPQAPSLTDPASLAGLRPGGGSGSVGATATFGVGGATRPASERATVSIGVSAHGVARLDTRGLAGTAAVLAEGANLQADAAKLYDDVRTQVMSLRGSPDVARLQELAGKAKAGSITAPELQEALALAGKVQGDLARAQQVLARMPGLLDDMDGLLTKLGGGALEARAGIVAAGYLEETVGVRSPTLRAGHHRFDAAVRGHLVQPGTMPAAVRNELGALDDMVAIRSTMVAVRAYIDVNATGLDQLRGTIGGLRGDIAALDGALGRAGGQLGAAAANPLGVMANARRFADDAQANIDALERQGKALSARADALEDQFDVDVEGGVEVTQPTARAGGGLDEVSVRWRWDPNQSFQLAVRAYAEHLVGALPGERVRLGLDPRAGSLTPLDRETVNTYSTFFPRTFGADVGLSIRRDTDTRTDVMMGISTDGRGATAHLGLVQHLGRRVMLRLGVVDPDITRTVDHTLLPRAGVDFLLGPRVEPSRVTLGLGGGAAVHLGGPGGGARISGGDAGLNLTIRFGSSGRPR